MSKPLFSSGIAAKAKPEGISTVKPLFDSAVSAAPASGIQPPSVSEPPAVVAQPLKEELVSFSHLIAEEPKKSDKSPEKEVVRPAVDDFFKNPAPLQFQEKAPRQQPVASPIFQGVRSFTDQAKDEILAVVPNATFLQIDFLQSLCANYYKLGFSVWQEFFKRLGNENVSISDTLHQQVVTHSSLKIADAIKQGTEFVSGSSGFLGFGKKSFDEVYSVLNAAVAPRDQIRTALNGLKSRVIRLQEQIQFVLKVVPNMPSVSADTDKIVQFLTPMESAVLMLESEVRLFEASFDRDMSAAERLLYTQLPAMRSRV